MSFDPDSFDPESFDPESFDPESFDPESFDPDSKQPDLDLYTVRVPPERQDLERERVRELLQSDDYFDPFALPFNPRADELSSDYGFYPVDLSQPAAPAALSGSQYQPEIPRQASVASSVAQKSIKKRKTNELSSVSAPAPAASSSSRQQQQPHTVLSSASSLHATSSSSGPLLSLHAPAPAAITTPAHNFNLNDMVYYNGVKYQITGVSDTSDTKIYTLQSLDSSRKVVVSGNSELKLDDTPESYAGQIGSLPSASSDLYGTPSAVVADERMHQCDEPGCLKYYAARSSLLRHKQAHTGVNIYKCEICKREFKQKHNLTIHMKIHQKPQTQQVPRVSSLAATVASPSLLVPLNLLEGKERDIELKKAAQKKAQEEREAQEIADQEARTLVANQKKAKKEHRCPHCSYAATQMGHLTTHVRTHTGEQPFECSVCNMRFTDKSNLRPHMLTHTGEKPFECSVCNMRFTQQAHLDRHMLRHTGERPFKCTRCKYAARQKIDLDKHERRHTGEQPYKCPQCSFKAGYSYKLKEHMQTEHPKPGAQPGAQSGGYQFMHSIYFNHCF